MLQGFENLWWEEMLKAGVALEEGQQCGSWIVWDGVQVVGKVRRLNKYAGHKSTHGSLRFQDHVCMHSTR